jgi:Tfp pilus assembly protein PilO
MRNYPLYIILQIILCAVLLFGLIMPKYRDLSRINSEIYSKDEELSSYKQYVDELKRITGEIKKNEDSLLKIEAALPSKPSLAPVLNFLQKEASLAGLSLEELNPSYLSMSKGEKIRTTQISIALSGSYPSLKQFVEKVEKSARIIDIVRIYFTYPRREGPFTFDILAKIYSY